MAKKDPYDELCFSLDQVKESKNKMATASNLIEFTTIETSLFKLLTAYIKITQNFAISTALLAEVENIVLSAYMLGELTENQINNWTMLFSIGVTPVYIVA